MIFNNFYSEGNKSVKVTPLIKALSELELGVDDINLLGSYLTSLAQNAAQKPEEQEEVFTE